MRGAQRGCDARGWTRVTGNHDTDHRSFGLRLAGGLDPVPHGEVGPQVADGRPRAAQRRGECEGAELVPRCRWQAHQDHAILGGRPTGGQEGRTQSTRDGVRGAVLGGEVARPSAQASPSPARLGIRSPCATCSNEPRANISSRTASRRASRIRLAASTKASVRAGAESARVVAVASAGAPSTRSRMARTPSLPCSRRLAAAMLGVQPSSTSPRIARSRSSDSSSYIRYPDAVRAGWTIPYRRSHALRRGTETPDRKAACLIVYIVRRT